MSSISRKLITLLALLALAVAQFAGLPGGWVCACSAEPVVVTEQWCTGGECHEGHSDGDHDHGPVEHREVRQSLQTVTAVPLQFVAPPLLELTPAVPAELGVRLSEECAAKECACQEWREDPGGGSGAEYARRTVVMLI